MKPTITAKRTKSCKYFLRINQKFQSTVTALSRIWIGKYTCWLYVMSGKIFSGHAVRDYWRTGRAPRVINLGTRRRWAVNVTPQLLYPWERTPVPSEQAAGWAPQSVGPFLRTEKTSVTWGGSGVAACVLLFMPTNLPCLTFSYYYLSPWYEFSFTISQRRRYQEGSPTFKKGLRNRRFQY